MLLSGELLRRQDESAYKSLEEKLCQERSLLRQICDDELAPASSARGVRRHPSCQDTGCNDLARLLDHHILAKRQDFVLRLKDKSGIPSWPRDAGCRSEAQEGKSDDVEALKAAHADGDDHGTMVTQMCASTQADFAKDDIQHVQHKLWYAEQLCGRTTYLNRMLRRENEVWRARDADIGPESLESRRVRSELEAERAHRAHAAGSAAASQCVATHAREQQRAAESKLRIAVDEMEAMRDEILALRAAAAARDQDHAAALEKLEREAVDARALAKREAQRLQRFRRGLSRVEKALEEDDELLQHKIKAVRIYRTKTPLPTRLLLADLLLS